MVGGVYFYTLHLQNTIYYINKFREKEWNREEQGYLRAPERDVPHVQSPGLSSYGAAHHGDSTNNGTLGGVDAGRDLTRTCNTNTLHQTLIINTQLVNSVEKYNTVEPWLTTPLSPRTMLTNHAIGFKHGQHSINLLAIFSYFRFEFFCWGLLLTSYLQH